MIFVIFTGSVDLSISRRSVGRSCEILRPKNHPRLASLIMTFVNNQNRCNESNESFFNGFIFDITDDMVNELMPTIDPVIDPSDPARFKPSNICRIENECGSDTGETVLIKDLFIAWSSDSLADSIADLCSSAVSESRNKAGENCSLANLANPAFRCNDSENDRVISTA